MNKRALVASAAACLILAVGPRPAEATPDAADRAVAAPSAAITCATNLGSHPFHPTVGLGSSGPDVREVQCRIGIWNGGGRPCCGFDGVFGSQTYQRVIDIQRWCRAATGRTDIAIDGIVGPVTWGMLHAYSCYG